jgi:alpha-N-arabinofuranosidase
VNVIGAIKTTKTAAEMETTGLMLQMYRAHFGQIPLTVEQQSGGIDISAALTKDGKSLTIGVMNPSSTELELKPSLSGAALGGMATRWHVTGANAEAHNTPGKPRVVDLKRTDGLSASDLRVPPLSAAVFVLPVK